METPEKIKIIASEAVNVLEKVAQTAKKKLAELSNKMNGHGQLASINSFNDTHAVDNMSEIAQSIQQGYISLQDEPAIARVTFDDGEQTKTLYIARKSSIPLEGDASLASYDSPLGHLASLQVGDEYTANIGGQSRVLEVLETLTLKPRKGEHGWDSSFSVYTPEDEETITIDPSLRKLFQQEEVDLSDESFLDELLSGETPSDFETGVKHQVRSAMSLRDQPILDKFQSEIFRLPLDSQLIILGPPGTGKTTTLIKRLGQKLNIEYLEPAEQQKIKNSHSGESGHKTNWLMFTPTDLLKHYLKEAFAKEQVPASSEQIKTWENYSGYLGRNVLPILQSSSRSGFIKKSSRHLNSYASSNLPAVYDSFIEFHKLSMVNELKASIDQLIILDGPLLKEISQSLTSLKQSLQQNDLISFYRSLEQYQDKIQNLIKEIKTDSEKQLRGALAYQVNSNKSFIAELIKVINEWKKSKLTEVIDDEEDDDEDEDQVVTPQQQAFSEYKKAINALGRAKYLKRSLPKNSLSTAIIKWLDGRLPEIEKLKGLGSLAIQMRELRKFKNPEVKYVKNIAKSYRAFRKSEEQFKKWFESSPAKPSHIEQSELDLLILANLKMARELLKERFILQKLDQGGYNQLNLINETFKNQILVDEATDFSPIQLASMEALTTPSIGSFFACGDFNQRITTEGTKNAEQLSWISSKLRTESINIVYRQSELLNNFAKELLTKMEGDIEYGGELPKNSNHKGVMPVLLENTGDNAQIVTWLKDRISEVEQEVDVLPSIAILVNHENEVKPLADALSEELEDLNIRAVACSDGQSLGEGNDVRVFDVQHIKGLEFEAVFFVGADILAENIPELFDKYLYVGATRAATFFGVTCHKSAPTLISNLRPSFQENWA